MIYQSEDIEIYNDLIKTVRREYGMTPSMGDLMLIVGKYFLGFPYVGSTLERKGEESLVINLREFDCFTFVENTVVLARLINRGKVAFKDYTAALEKIRYRNSIVNGYPSRLHYFSDWLSDNEKQGIVKIITKEKVGKPLLKEINYMTAHRDDYSRLRTDKSFQEMMALEKNLSGRSLYSIPKAEFMQCENVIENGDLIAMTTSIEGLDVVHVGLSVFLQRGVHLLHASEVEKTVVISDTTLLEYLSRRQTITGIMVCRVRDACQSDGNRETN